MKHTAWLCSIATLSLAGTAWAQEPSWDAFVESDALPIRVLYTEDVGEAKARETLGYAEEAWQAQIVEMGFLAPHAENESGEIVEGLWIYLDPSSPTNHIEPTAEIEETAASDCAARVVIPSVRPTSFLEMFTAYGLNVASELGTDCVESFFAYQQTGVAVTVLRWPQDQTFLGLALPAFQASPQRGVDCTFPNEQERYFYGAGSSLFQVFLEEAFGSGDGSLLAGLWQAARQDGSGMSAVNDPTLLDAMRTVLGETTLEQAFIEFARWRWFVGARDDGEHFRHGGEWAGNEVAVDTALAIDDLPVRQASLADVPDDFGTAYVTVDLAGLDRDKGLRFAWQGDQSVGWNVDALLVRADGTADVQAAGDGGELTVGPLGDYPSIVFVVSDLGSAAHDPGAPDCTGMRSLQYDLELADPTAPGEPDASATPDAGVDAGADAGSEPPPDDEGCSCSSTGGNRPDAGAGAVLALVGLVWARGVAQRRRCARAAMRARSGTSR